MCRFPDRCTPRRMFRQYQHVHRFVMRIIKGSNIGMKLASSVIRRLRRIVCRPLYNSSINRSPAMGK